jgi:hypothetical protein
MNRRALLKSLVAAVAALAPTSAVAASDVRADLARLPDPRDDLDGFLDAVDRDPALRRALAGRTFPVFRAEDVSRAISDEIVPIFDTGVIDPDTPIEVVTPGGFVLRSDGTWS